VTGEKYAIHVDVTVVVAPRIVVGASDAGCPMQRAATVLNDVTNEPNLDISHLLAI
jgi:hypothetical protein